MSAQSTLDPPNKLTITSQLNRVHVVMSGETHFEFTVKSDGHPMAVPANPAFNQVELRKIDKSLAPETVGEHCYAEAAALFLQLVEPDTFETFLTLPAYKIVTNAD